MKHLNPRSLRVRLTVWYSCALILIALVLAGASRWALAVSLDHALDRGLRYRLIGLHRFIGENSHEGLNRLTARLGELDTLGELFQVFGSRGELMAQSEGLARHHVSTRPPPDPGVGILSRSAGPRWFPIRMATQRIYVNGQPLIIEVADPEGKYQGALNEFYSVLFVALPIVLVIAALGGYWLSGRALGPVDQIIDEAQAIDPANLAARLSVPASGDELQRLSETLNRMLDRVERSVLQVRRFTADASHELRAPMTLIYTAAQFALRRDRSADELKDALRKILRAAKRCTELINQLLLLARSDAGSSRLELALTDLTALVGDVVNEVKMLAADKGLNVSMNLPDRPVLVAVEEHSFRRMLLILLDNAIKYTPAGGSVTVSLIGETDGLAIAVADTGAGIPPAELPFIFDRFWRADKVRSREAGGTGLGLAIAREIAQAHAAELTADSCVGSGSTFTVRLPRSEERLNAPRPAQQLSEPRA
ncbi:MAG TPA: ATP-binding protein [Bryobacteraceae bacterium]|nr:ATP-binding protein [Bryobacteraceae bacterium]